MIVQQSAVILVLLQEGVSTCPSTLPHNFFKYKWIKLYNQKAQSGQMVWWNKTTIYCLQETTETLRTHIGSKWKDGKRFYMQMEKRNWIDTLYQRRHTNSQQVHERCSTSLIIREIHIKTTMRYHFTPIRMTIIKKTRHKCWWGCREKGNLVHSWWEWKLVQPLWKTVWRFLKKLKLELPYDPELPLLFIYPERNENKILRTYLHLHIHCIIIHSCQGMETT